MSQNHARHHACLLHATIAGLLDVAMLAVCTPPLLMFGVSPRLPFARHNASLLHETMPTPSPNRIPRRARPKPLQHVSSASPVLLQHFSSTSPALLQHVSNTSPPKPFLPRFWSLQQSLSRNEVFTCAGCINLLPMTIHIPCHCYTRIPRIRPSARPLGNLAQRPQQSRRRQLICGWP